MILWQINRLIVHERRRGGQGSQKPQQPIAADKPHNCLPDLSLSLAVHLQSPYIQRVQHHPLRILQRVVDLRLRSLCRSDIKMAVPGFLVFSVNQ